VVGHFAAFLAIAAVVIVTPGPDTALTIRNTLLRSRRSGIFTALGVVSGQATWALATSAGIAALLRASEPAFVALKLVGAAYLILLGAQAIRNAFASGKPSRLPACERSPRHTSAVSTWRHGMVSNLTNPKMAAFFPSLLPQFAGHGGAAFLPLILLGLVFCTLTLAWLTAYAVAVAKAGDVLRRPRVRRTLEGLTGAALVGLGVRVAGQHR
jgi:threonine/homoserine/homoserine lactone efflux protein